MGLKPTPPTKTRTPPKPAAPSPKSGTTPISRSGQDVDRGYDDYGSGEFSPEYTNWLAWFNNPNNANYEFLQLGQQAWGKQFVANMWLLRNADEEALRGALIARGYADPWSVLGRTKAGPGGRGYGGGGGGASQAEQEASAAAAIKNQAATLGLNLNDGEIAYVAKAAVDGSWSGEQLNDWLVGRAITDQTAGKLGMGTISRGVDEIKQMAADQLITISDDTARNYSFKIQSGEMDPAVLKSLFQQQAAARYAWAEPVLSKGISMKDYLVPSRDAIANELEKPAESIDMMDSKWLDMMQTIDSKGQTRAATQSEITSRVRKLDEFKSTTRAKDLTSQAAMYLRQYMGA